MTTSISTEFPSLSVEPKYDLWRVDYIDNETFECVAKYYLCDDSDAMQAFIEAALNDYDGAGWEIEVEHYPSIREDYPDAVVIPPMSNEFKDFVAHNLPSNK